MPPGAVGYRNSSGPSMPHEAVGATSAAISAANNHTRMTLEALMDAPSRELQPHLHPKKLNGALWFGIDPSVHKFIKTTWQAYYMGPWRSWKFVPDERKDKWWHTFVQNYYWEARFNDDVYNKWKVHTQTTICGKISKKKRENQNPKYISEDDWTTLLEYWSSEPAIKKSKDAVKYRTSNPDGKGMHKHCAGPQNFLKIEYDMMVESGLDEPPPYTEFVRKTHTRDGSFIDGRAETLVLEVEEAVAQMETDSVSETTSTAATPSRLLLNQEFLKQGKTSRGRVYGIGSVQQKEFILTASVHASLQRSLDMDMCISSVETHSEAVNNNVETLKSEMTELKENVVAMKDEMKEELTLLACLWGQSSEFVVQPPLILPDFFMDNAAQKQIQDDITAAAAELDDGDYAVEMDGLELMDTIHGIFHNPNLYFVK
ncbi:unnamed protein product, partial [Thlaspi arvense]